MVSWRRSTCIMQVIHTKSIRWHPSGRLLNGMPKGLEGDIWSETALWFLYYFATICFRAIRSSKVPQTTHAHEVNFCEYADFTIPLFMIHAADIFNRNCSRRQILTHSAPSSPYFWQVQSHLKHVFDGAQCCSRRGIMVIHFTRVSCFANEHPSDVCCLFQVIHHPLCLFIRARTSASQHCSMWSHVIT